MGVYLFPLSPPLSYSSTIPSLRSHPSPRSMPLKFSWAMGPGECCKLPVGYREPQLKLNLVHLSCKIRHLVAYIHTLMHKTLINFSDFPENQLVPSVLWHCWLGGRKGIQPVKKLSGRMLAWLCVCVKVKICIWHSWCHCHSLSLAPVNPGWFYLPSLTFLVLTQLGSPGQNPRGP